MDVLGQFLETSTIHGLGHIVRSQSKIAKCLWTLTVLSWFFAAGMLINNAYIQWRSSPIATTISTHSIASLPFPEVVVCPLKGSNTALNQDLVKVAGQNKNIEQIKDAILQAVDKAFLRDPHFQYAYEMMHLIESSNLKNVYKGYQNCPQKKTFPRSRPNLPKKGYDGFHIKTTALRGSFDSQLDKAIYNKYTVQFPKKIRDFVGNRGTLVLQLSVRNLRETEYVTINRGLKYMSRQGGQGYSWDESLTWDEAENACLEKGGHLASVLSAEERKSLGDGEHTMDSFLGGKRINGTWTWSDGSPFNDSGTIFILEEKPGDCLKHSTASIHTTDCSTILYYYWSEFSF